MRPLHVTRWRAVTAASFCAVLAAWVGCTETAGPDEPFSIQFDPPAAPSIVSGDSLRDIEGVATPLRAVVYNLRGAPLDAAITFIAIDTSDSIVIDPSTGYVVASGPNRGTVRIVASAGSLQSAPINLEIIARPAAVARSGTLDTLRYSFSNPSLNTSAPLRVLVTRDSANAPVPRYLVRFRLDRPADTVVARLVDDAGRRSPLDPTGATALDTTGTDGIASRQIRLTPNASLRLPADSIVVFADVRLGGAPVAGSPVRLTLFVKPRTTP